jgi:hypothetical protein
LPYAKVRHTSTVLAHREGKAMSTQWVEYTTPNRDWREAEVDFDMDEDYDGYPVLTVNVYEIRGCDENGNPIEIDITDDEEEWAQEAGCAWDERDRALDREP